LAPLTPELRSSGPEQPGPGPPLLQSSAASRLPLRQPLSQTTMRTAPWKLR